MKKELTQLEHLVRKIADYFKDDRLTTMSVIIQNMAFRSDKAEWRDFDDQLEILKLNAKFRPDCHVSQWVYTEAKMIVDGHFMSVEDNLMTKEEIQSIITD